MVQVPVIRSWVSVGRNRNYVGRHGLVECPDGSFPCPEDLIRLDARAPKLPVTSKRVGVARKRVQVCNEHQPGTFGRPDVSVPA